MSQARELLGESQDSSVRVSPFLNRNVDGSSTLFLREGGCRDSFVGKGGTRLLHTDALKVPLLL